MYYSSVVGKWMRFYFRYPDTTKFDKQKAKNNWLFCKRLIDDLPAHRKDFYKRVYTSKSVGKVIDEYSFENDIKTNILWQWITELEYEFAKRKEI